MYSCVQYNSKKVSKAQNPYNSYRNTHKYIGNIARSTLNQSMKKNVSNLSLLYRNRRKRNIRLFKKIAVSACFFTKSNIYCINWKMLEDLDFLWITELIFRCVARVSENCFTSVLHGVDQLLAPVNRSSSPTWLHYRLLLHHFSLGQSVCSLSYCNLFSTCLYFNNRTLLGLLADSLASHRRLLIVTVLKGNIRLSLITLELIIGWVFAILAILRSIRMVVFRFLPFLSGFGCHFKAFDIIYLSSLNFLHFFMFFSSLIHFLIKVRCFSEQCLVRPILLRFLERNTQYNICCLRP